MDDDEGQAGPGFTALNKRDAAAGSWVIANFKGEESGTGSDLASFLEAFDEAEIQFAVILVMGVDERKSVTSNRPKLVRINWIGKSVSPMKKSKALRGKEAISKLWRGVGVELNAEQASEISAKEIAEGLLKAGAAHKPTFYDFGSEKYTIEK